MDGDVVASRPDRPMAMVAKHLAAVEAGVVALDGAAVYLDGTTSSSLSGDARDPNLNTMCTVV